MSCCRHTLRRSGQNARWKPAHNLRLGDSITRVVRRRLVLSNHVVLLHLVLSSASVQPHVFRHNLSVRENDYDYYDPLNITLTALYLRKVLLRADIVRRTCRKNAIKVMPQRRVIAAGYLRPLINDASKIFGDELHRSRHSISTSSTLVGMTIRGHASLLNSSHQHALHSVMQHHNHQHRWQPSRPCRSI